MAKFTGGLPIDRVWGTLLAARTLACALCGSSRPSCPHLTDGARHSQFGYSAPRFLGLRPSEHLGCG